MSDLDRYTAELLVRGYEDADRERVKDGSKNPIALFRPLSTTGQ